MMDNDLAKLYGMETKVLKQAVRRNMERFPLDFMFELTQKENKILRSQIVTLERGQYSKYLPFAFTEYGVLILSSVLNSPKAIQVNIQIMRIFTNIRQLLADNTELRLEVEQIKQKVGNHSKNIELVFQYLDELLEKKEKPALRKQMGYKLNTKNQPNP